jgi:hypothetical protein
MLHAIAVDKHAMPMLNVKMQTKQMTATSELVIILNIHAMPTRLENIQSKERIM